MEPLHKNKFDLWVCLQKLLFVPSLGKVGRGREAPMAVGTGVAVHTVLPLPLPLVT